MSSAIGSRYVKTDEIKNIFNFDANNLYDWAMIQSLPYEENKFDKKVFL